MSQSDSASYGYSADVGQAGQLADVGPHRIDTFAAETAVEFGQAVKRGTNAQKQAVICDTDTDTFLGVAVFTHSKEQGYDPSATPSSTGARYDIGDAMNILREGRILVNVAATVTAGAPAYVDPATAEFTATSASMIGPVGTFVTGRTDAGLVEVDIVR